MDSQGSPNRFCSTRDGGLQWTSINERRHPEEVERFPFTFSLVSLDQSHMAAMMKEGSAQFYAQAFLFTEDSGTTWKFLNIPNVTLYSFLRANGADTVSVASLDYVLDRENPLFARLDAFLRQ